MNTSACLVGCKICLCACLGFAAVSTPYKVAEGLKTRAHRRTQILPVERQMCLRRSL